MKYNNEDRQKAFDWLKNKITPRLPYVKGVNRMTKEQLDLITIDLDDELNKARLHYLFQMVWRNWVSGCDWMNEDWNFRLLEPIDLPLIAMDDDCDCCEYEEGDPTYCDLVQTIFYNDSEYFKENDFILYVYNMEQLDVQCTVEDQKRALLFYKWKYEPDTLTEREKKAVKFHRFETRDEAEIRRWFADDSFVLKFPMDEEKDWGNYERFVRMSADQTELLQ